MYEVYFQRGLKKFETLLRVLHEEKKNDEIEWIKTEWNKQNKNKINNKQNHVLLYFPRKLWGKLK